MTLVEMGTHLATERAGMVTLHLTVGASELYPNRSWRSGAGSKPQRAAAVKSDGGVAPMLRETSKRVCWADLHGVLLALGIRSIAEDSGRNY